MRSRKIIMISLLLLVAGTAGLHFTMYDHMSDLGLTVATVLWVLLVLGWTFAITWHRALIESRREVDFLSGVMRHHDAIETLIRQIFEIRFPDGSNPNGFDRWRKVFLHANGHHAGIYQRSTTDTPLSVPMFQGQPALTPEEESEIQTLAHTAVA